MPLDPLERVVLLTQYKKMLPAHELLRKAGRKMALVGRLSDSELLDMLEAWKEKSDILEKIVAELMETGTLSNTEGAGKTLMEIYTTEPTQSN